jgi:hypothetical protein
MVTRPHRLKEYLASLNLPGELRLPWVHSTSASNLIDIIADGKLLATPCNVFRQDKLCYFFVGRPAYKMKPTENPSTWQLPVAFVVRFEKPPPIKRIFPFDSGAFHERRLPDYITMFKMDGYDRAAAIELQIEQDIEIRQDNLLGIVMPTEYSRVPGLMQSITGITKNVETYDHYPLGLGHHFAFLYERVKAIYKLAGINIES